MKCKRCGSEISPDYKFCGTCGEPVPVPVPDPVPDQNHGSYREPDYSQNQNNNMGYEENSNYNFGYANNNENEFGYNQNNMSTNVQNQGNNFNYEPSNNSNNFSYNDSNNDYRDNANDFYIKNKFDTKGIRKWFNTTSIAIPLILIIIGIPLAAVVVGIVFIVIGVILLVIASGNSNSDKVDKATEFYIDALKQRAVAKLNILSDEESLIEPVTMINMGVSPDPSFAKIENISKGGGLLFKLILWPFTLYRVIKTMFNADDNPYEAWKVGYDDRLRTLLLGVTVYFFSEDQIYAYNGNVDISTGLVYNERTYEIFYQDIEGIEFVQELVKVFSAKKKKGTKKVVERFMIYLGGCTLSEKVLTSFNGTLINEQITAMRNLVRDKKNA